MRFAAAALLALAMCSPQRTHVEPRTKMTFVSIPQRTFSLGIHEVTQREWTAVMGSNPSHFRSIPTCPSRK